jgi:hypothetical protein
MNQLERLQRLRKGECVSALSVQESQDATDSDLENSDRDCDPTIL